MARRHRRYRSYVQIPGLSGLMDPLKWNVNASDVFVGVLAGLVGSAAVKFILNKVKVALPVQLAPVQPILTSGAAGAALYFGQGKSNRGAGHAIGATAAGVALAAMDFLKTNASTRAYFADVVSIPGLGYYNGTLIDEATPMIGPGGYQGLIVNEPGRAMGDYGMQQLAALSMGEDRSGLEELMDE